uniref:sensor histidine kinase n=1 Tax=Flavobacterium filum TaxID=370974 RepID=UPI0023F1C7FC
LATKMKDNNRLKDVYLSIAEVNERRGDYKTAYKFHRLFSAMNDTLFSKDYSKQVAEMTTKYETEKKDKELIRKDFEFKEQQKQKNYLMVFSISSLVVLLVLLLSLLFFKKANTKIKSKNEQLKKQNYEIEQKKEEINKQAVQIAKYQSQMNPHFIFNAINGIQSIVLKEDKIKAVQQIQSLSKLLRTTLNNSESEFISLEEEKSYLYKYIEFELHRFANKFKFSFIVDEGISYKATIPTMIIQPFIENAIKHGELNNLKNGEISVYIKPHPEFKERLITISIRDNGAGIQIKNEKSETQKHQSKGLKITKSRLLLELKKSNLVISNYFNIKSPIFETGPNFGTEVVITAPFHKT